MEIREASPLDAPALAAIYNHNVETTTISFEERAIAEDEMVARLEAVRSSGLPWYVASDQSFVCGYAYAQPWKARSAYRFSSEVTVYVAAGQSGKGIGRALYGRLLPSLQHRGLHTALAGIALPNQASIVLHERFGFRKVAHLSQVGFKMQRWVDVGYWQLILKDLPEELRLRQND